MNKMKSIIGLLCLAASLIFTSGCASTRLAEGGAYQDPVLYQADKTIVGSYNVLHGFVSWEKTHRAVLPVEVSRAADAVRAGLPRWLDSANALRDAYAANPSEETKSNLNRAIDLLLAALSEASRYMIDYEADNPSSVLRPQSSAAPRSIEEPSHMPSQAPRPPGLNSNSNSQVIPQAHPNPASLPESPAGAARLAKPGDPTDPSKEPQRIPIR